jgi:hypothetical protein
VAIFEELLAPLAFPLEETIDAGTHALNLSIGPQGLSYDPPIGATRRIPVDRCEHLRPDRIIDMNAP